jgi:hypothetical protein
MRKRREYYSFGVEKEKSKDFGILNISPLCKIIVNITVTITTKYLWCFQMKELKLFSNFERMNPDFLF